MHHHSAAPTSRRRTRSTLAALGVVALALTGCSVADQSGSGNGTGTASAATEATGGQSGGAKGNGETVTVMTHDSFNITDEQIAAFEEQSGYELTTTAPGDAGTLVNQLILAKDNPTVDAVYGIDNLSAQRVIDEGVVAEYASEALPASAEDLAVADKLTPIDQGQVCVNTDHEWFQEKGMAEPTSLDDLAKPEYAELLVTTNPVTSSPGLAFLAATVTEKGEDGWQDYWRQLLEGGTKVAAGWSDAYYSDFSGGEGKGAYPLVLSYSSSPAYAPTTGVVEDTCTTQVEYAGVVEGAKNPEGAQAFIDFLLTEDFQASLPENMFMYPVDDSVELPADWTEHATLVKDPIEADLQQVSEQREAWLKEWNELYESTN
ncbi:MAG: thiamine ABC transporter substrate-binding protein [Micrococcus sp.]|nr:thiamine ABC transporter substrate-binding protein [Micrococcus sp.]